MRNTNYIIQRRHLLLMYFEKAAPRPLLALEIDLKLERSDKSLIITFLGQIRTIGITFLFLAWQKKKKKNHVSQYAQRH